jgi:hypothetical protein
MSMKEEIIEVSSDFWNIRGSFKIGGVVDIKTHASLVRRTNGNFVFLDSYSLGPAAREQVADIVGSDGEIEAILNVHPFHTMHVAKMHALYPAALLYGTARHLELFPDLPWEAELTEDPELHDLYADDFEFSVPEGVDFISANDNIHFSSVLVMHQASHTIHVDDTFMYIQLPLMLRLLGIKDSLGFHPTLSSALQKRSGAAADFRAWARALIDDWEDAENLCAAHTGPLLAGDNTGAPIPERIKKALRRCEPALRIHQYRYG